MIRTPWRPIATLMPWHIAPDRAVLFRHAPTGHVWPGVNRRKLSIALGSVLDNSMLIDHETARSIAAGMARLERKRNAELIAQPMRELFDMLSGGEAIEIDGQVMMRMPEIDQRFADQREWVEVAPAIDGWIDCWRRIAPDISTYHMSVLADRLRQDKPITPRLVELAREEFEATVARIADVEPGRITSAITTTRIAWEFEKMDEAQGLTEGEKAQ